MVKQTIQIGNKLREWRQSMQLTQPALAAKVGVSTESIWRWEHNRPVDKGSLALLRLAGFKP